MKHNQFFYTLLCILAGCCLSSCEIEDKDLPGGVFDTPWQGGNSNSSYLSNYSVNSNYRSTIGDHFTTYQQIAFELTFSDAVKEYKYLFSTTPLEDFEVLQKLSEKDAYIPDEMNYVTYTYTRLQDGKDIYLYALGLNPETKTRGVITSKKVCIQPVITEKQNSTSRIFPVKQGSGSYASGYEFSWQFGASPGPFEYVILFNEEAQWAKKLSDPALILLIQKRGQTIRTNVYQGKEMHIQGPAQADYMFIATHVIESLTTEKLLYKIS